MSRLSNIFHNSNVANACPTGSPGAPGTPSPNSPAKEDTPGSPSGGTGNNSQSREQVLNPRENLRSIVRELLEEAETNPACEGVRKRIIPSESNSSSIVHTIGSCIPTPVHDFLKDVVDRLHKITRRVEDNVVPTVISSTAAPSGSSESKDSAPSVPAAASASATAPSSGGSQSDRVQTPPPAGSADEPAGN